MPAAKRGRLKVYLGATAGSGKTYAMLHEGRERRAHGEDVVVGFVETHGRPRTLDAIGSLEVVPRVRLEYRNTQLEEMDVDAVLHRHPHVALIDELAHTNAPGVRHEKRWQDVEELRDAGIDVITTVNVQHLESVKDLVEGITGVVIRETVPDRILDHADEIRFIDITPEALRKRMRHGNIYPPERVETALSHFFRPGNLGALRELGLRVVADHMETAGIEGPPEDVLVAVSGDAGSDVLVRRAVRIARRRRGMCTVLHVTGPQEATTSEWETVASQLECPVIRASARNRRDVANIIVSTAHQRGARHVVVGEARDRGLRNLRGDVVDAVVEKLADCDLHVIARYAAWRSPEVRKTPEEMLAAMHPPPNRGQLRLYLGYAPGCGATTTMLAEAVRRHSRGTDIVIAVMAKGHDFEGADVPVLGGSHSPASRGQLDLSALLAANPDVCVLDNLAGKTLTGLPIVDAIPTILDAGITVLGTVCLADIKSVAGSVSQVAAVGHDIEFLSLDMINSAAIRCFRTPRRTILIFGQWSDLAEDDPKSLLGVVRRTLEETDA